MRRDKDLSCLSDESLLSMIQEREHAAFAVLVRRHCTRFHRIAYRLVFDKHEAEDVLQEAFLRVWDRPTAWDRSKHTKFTTWFYRVLTNLCIDHNRKKRPLPLPEASPIADPKPGQDVTADARDRQELLEALIQELPARQQLALDLCFYEGLSNQEAAEILGVRLKALQSLIMRAKTTLKERASRYFTRGGQ